MKFITRKGAPNIPLEIIEAQESFNLVFFCGAGISFSAGLPGFAGLVDKVYEELGEQKQELELEAIKAGLYDRALGLLEARIVGEGNPSVNLVRKAIINQLTIADDADLDAHRAILSLSKTENSKYRLVTTNIDHGFKKALPEIQQMIDYAPKLPVPKPYKWSSIVHLHGIIDANYPNGEHLIFTSGDFGSAYLTERWASKFVTELFTHFSVIFIGYSVNDPVIRYMTDAIAAERLRGYRLFKQPYAFGHTKPSKKSDNEKAWRAKGIEPILYEYSHKNLYNTLIEWNKYVRDGLNAKARVVIKEGRIAPLSPFEQDPSVARMLDVLSEKTRPNNEEVTGYPAKIFSQLTNPPAPIEWLPVLHEKRLLSIAQQNETVFPINSFPGESNLATPNSISLHLWHWLLNHLENENLIRWVIDQGVCLHPILKNMIERHMEKNSLHEPYLRFWKIVTSNFANCGKGMREEGYDNIIGFRKGIDQLSIAELIRLLEPSFQLSKSIDMSDLWDDDEERSDTMSPYEIEVVIRMADWVYHELTQLEAYPSRFIDLLLPATQALVRALEFWEFAGLADKLHDKSHWNMVSISPHSQNRRHDNWVILIEICRDLWEAAWENNEKVARTVLDIWRSIKYPTFRRLTLHALTTKDVENPDVAVEFLLEDNGWWLWSVETRREVFRFLNTFWPKLDEVSSERLIEIILEGPPRDMYREDFPLDEWRHLFDREVWLMLAKLQNFSGNLPAKASTIFRKLMSENPDWALQEEERDEFTFWMETRAGHDVDLTIDKLFDKPTYDLVMLLSDNNQSYGEGRINSFRVGCKGHREKAIEVLKFLTINKNWNGNIWHAGLVGLAESDNTWNEIAPLLNEADTSLYKEEPWAIAHWVEKHSSLIKPDTPEESFFWSIFRTLAENCTNYKELNQIDDAVSYAINNPIGVISEALIDRFGARKISAGNGIPSGELQDSLNYLISSNKISLFAGKIILASRLHYFHLIDPDWTKTNLIPLFDWENFGFAKLIWKGYLRNPRISADLALDLKNYLAIAVSRIDHLGKDGERLIQLFAIVCLEYPELYKPQEQQNALIQSEADGLGYIAEMFWRSIAGDPKSADNYWRNRIQPFMKRAWPKSAQFVSEKISRYLSLVAIELHDAFEEALDFLFPFIIPISDMSYLLTHLVRKELPDKQPAAVFRLLSKLFSENYQWPRESFRQVLNRLTGAEPLIQNEPIYRTMNDYLIRHNI